MQDADRPGTLIFRVLAGSRAYGLHSESSDTDTRGICIPPKAALIGLAEFEQYQDDKSDNVVFSLVKFLRLSLEGNPNLIETLYTEDVLYCHPLAQRLLAERQRFLSRKVADRFGHYAFQQLKRLKNHSRWWQDPPVEPTLEAFGGGLNAAGSAHFPSGQARRAYEQARKHWGHFQRWQNERNPARAELESRYGYDTKHAMHLCRLLTMGLEILREGKVLVRRPDRDWLLQVRAGALSLDELLTWAGRAEAELSEARAHSPLPEEPDQPFLEELMMGIIEDFYWPKR